MYHRVIDPKTLPYPLQDGMYVRPETFAMHCEVLKNECEVLSADELVKRVLVGDTLSNGTIALTFDDGWLDNYENALPILEKARLPASMYLPTKFIDSNEIFWTDSVAYSLKRAGESNQLESTLNYLFSLSREDRQRAIDTFLITKGSTTRREFMSWSEVRDAAERGIRFGSHSHSHQLFRELTPEEREFELRESLRILQEQSVLGSGLFVFPGGSFSPEMGPELLREGYIAGLRTLRRSKIDPSSPIFPRVAIHEDVSNTRERFLARVVLR